MSDDWWNAAPLLLIGFGYVVFAACVIFGGFR